MPAGASQSRSTGAPPLLAYTWSVGEGVAATKAALTLMRNVAVSFSTSAQIRNLAASLVQNLPERDQLAEATALFDYVRDNVRFLRDPATAEMIQSIDYMLSQQVPQGDCDDKCTLLASLLLSIGFPVRFVAVGYQKNVFVHVLLQVQVNGAWIWAECSETARPLQLGQQAQSLPYSLTMDIESGQFLGASAMTMTVQAEKDVIIPPTLTAAGAAIKTAEANDAIANLSAGITADNEALAATGQAAGTMSAVAAAIGAAAAKAAGATVAGPTVAQQQLAAYVADATFDTSGPFNYTPALNESYYQYLPAEVRGHVVPSGYPVGQAGLDTLTGTFPRIFGISPNVDNSVQMIDFSQLRMPGVPSPSTMSVSDFLSLPATTEIVPNLTWYNSDYGVAASYQPRREFDRRYQAEQVWADPTDPYWQNAFQAWKEDDYALELERAIAGVAVAIGGAYLLAPLSGTAAAAGGGTAAAAGGAAAAGADTAAGADASVINLETAAGTGDAAAAGDAAATTAATVAASAAPASAAAPSVAAATGGGISGATVAQITGALLTTGGAVTIASKQAGAVQAQAAAQEAAAQAAEVTAAEKPASGLSAIFSNLSTTDLLLLAAGAFMLFSN